MVFSQLLEFFWILFNPFVPNAPFLYPLKTENPYGFLMFSGGTERVHWERMGQFICYSIVIILLERLNGSFYAFLETYHVTFQFRVAAIFTETIMQRF